MSTDIAVITVPLQEWNDLQNRLESIDKSLLEIKGKGKSEFITPNEVCELLKCSRNTYQSYIQKGFLEPIKMKSEKYSKLLFKRVDVEYYLNSRIGSN
jgi:hypothetical protein